MALMSPPASLPLNEKNLLAVTASHHAIIPPSPSYFNKQHMPAICLLNWKAFLGRFLVVFRIKKADLCFTLPPVMPELRKTKGKGMP